MLLAHGYECHAISSAFVANISEPIYQQNFMTHAHIEIKKDSI